MIECTMNCFPHKHYKLQNCKLYNELKISIHSKFIRWTKYKHNKNSQKRRIKNQIIYWLIYASFLNFPCVYFRMIVILFICIFIEESTPLPLGLGDGRINNRYSSGIIRKLNLMQFDHSFFSIHTNFFLFLYKYVKIWILFSLDALCNYSNNRHYFFFKRKWE